MFLDTLAIMLLLIIALISLLILVFIAGCLAYFVINSQQIANPQSELHFFLPHGFFISLTMLANFWLVLLILLGAQELSPTEKQMLVVIISLFAPFLAWWHQKKGEAE